MTGVPDPISAVLTLWAGVGLIVAIAFLLLGFDKVDPGARGAYAVRPLLLPGLILLWPIVIWRWLSLSKGQR
jgi:hypothetical protein